MNVQSPAPRRVKPPRWLDLRLLLGLALVVASVLLGAFAFSRAQHTSRVLATTRELAAGTTLSAGDVRFVSVKLPSDAHSHYLARRAAAVGKQLTRDLGADELLPSDAVHAAPTRTTLSVPLAAGAAPTLRAGERIEIWLSTKACASVVLLSDVTVQSVHDSGAAGLVHDGGQDVVLSVAPELADRVISALAGDGATVRAGVITGARQAHSGAPLPDLHECLAGSSP